MPPRDWLYADRWWGPRWCISASTPGASLSHSAAASLRLGPRRVVPKHRPGPGPSPFPPSSGQTGRWELAIRTGGYGSSGALVSSCPAPTPVRTGTWGWGKVSASPAPQGPRDGVPTILVRLVGRGLRRLLERPRDVEELGWGRNLIPYSPPQGHPSSATTPPPSASGQESSCHGPADEAVRGWRETGEWHLYLQT